MPNKNQHIPYRRCIGCMDSKPQAELIRIAYGGESPRVDCEGKLPGRGTYMCRSAECIEKALKRKSFQRVFKGKCSDEDLKKVIDDLMAIIER